MLSAKSKPYIDASVPVLREHGLTITTVFYNRLFENHPELKNLFNAGNQANGSQQQSLASAVFAYAANIENSAALAPVIERIVHKHVSVGIKPEHYPIVGQHLIAAIQEVLGDAATPELLDAWVEAYGLLADALIATEQALYSQNKHAPDSWIKMMVVEKKQVSDGIISYTLKSQNNTPLPKFKAGQYMSVAVFLESLNLRQIRQYSLSDSTEKDTYRITVKSEKANASKPEGMVSNWIHQHLDVGSIIDGSHPYGNFTPAIMNNEPIALISAGVGITPMISILNTMKTENPNRKVLFTHTTRSKNEVPYLQEIEVAKAQMPNLTVKLRSRGEEENQEANEHAYDIHYICGPQAFMDDQRAVLLSLGIKENCIHREVFGPESLNHLI